jgi:transcription antitermination factor NusG
LPERTDKPFGVDVQIDKSQYTSAAWYAIHVRTRFETVAADTLVGKGLEVFMPVYRARRQWSDRIKEIEMPLFPGYLFCRIDLRGRLLPILTTPGVIAILGAGNMPSPVPEREIAAIQLAIRSGLPAQPCPYPSVGARVLIERGPLAGVEGIVLSSESPGHCKKRRLVVSVHLLQRSIAVEIQPEWARAVSGNGIPHTVLAERPRNSAISS